MSDEKGRVALRQRGATVIPVTIAVLGVLFTVASFAQDSFGNAVYTLLLMATVWFGFWLLLGRPALVVDDDGVSVVNPVRTTRIPFGALDDFKVGGLAVFFARTGGDGRVRKISSWNAPGVPRRPPRRPSYLGDNLGAPPERRSLQSPTTLQVEPRLEAWQRSHRQGEPSARATSSWAWREWGALAVAVLALIAIRLL